MIWLAEFLTESRTCAGAAVLRLAVLATLLIFAALVSSNWCHAQEQSEWIKISAPDKRFQVFFPRSPQVTAAENSYDTKYGRRTARGELYSIVTDKSSYQLWVFETLRAPSTRADEQELFLDEYADMVWESLLKPVRNALPKNKSVIANMAYKSELTMGVIPGREYLLTLEERKGVARFYMDGGRLYVLVVLSFFPNSPVTENFLSRFVAKSLTGTPFLPMPEYIVGTTTRYDRPLKPSETTTRAKVLSKPEPQYTEAARKFRVTGRVVLQAEILTNGRVAAIHAVKRLPHGLTDAAITAAEQTRFEPATKDGLVVRQSIQLEYDFNLY